MNYGAASNGVCYRKEKQVLGVGGPALSGRQTGGRRQANRQAAKLHHNRPGNLYKDLCVCVNEPSIGFCDPRV